MLLAFSFGSLWAAVSIRRTLEAKVAHSLAANGTSVFATLESSRQISRAGRTHYFFSYSGYLNNQQFRREEQVSADLFFLQSEGKNTIVRAVQDRSGQIYTHIDRNPVPYPSDLQLVGLVSLILAGFGFILILVGGTWRMLGR